MVISTDTERAPVSVRPPRTREDKQPNLWQSKKEKETFSAREKRPTQSRQTAASGSGPAASLRGERTLPTRPCSTQGPGRDTQAEGRDPGAQATLRGWRCLPPDGGHAGPGDPASHVTGYEINTGTSLARLCNSRHVESEICKNSIYDGTKNTNYVGLSLTEDTQTSRLTPQNGSER